PLGELVHQYLDAVGLLAYYRSQSTEEALDRFENIARLIADITQYAVQAAESNSDASLADYMQHVSLLTSVDEAATGDAVQLMTLHAAKGLEFPVVIIAGLNEGLLPLVRATTTESDNAEERRLFYVGITRARKRLLLTYSRNRSRFGLMEGTLPSRFLGELPQELLDADRPDELHRTAFRGLLAGLPRAEKRTQHRTAGNGFRPGQRVLHPAFGSGTIEDVEGRGADAKVRVRFDIVGTKLLLIRYAPLELME
ncbi:MAG: hypothetical protein D6747_07025, partial [Chlorobiota bacterium]